MDSARVFRYGQLVRGFILLVAFIGLVGCGTKKGGGPESAGSDSNSGRDASATGADAGLGADAGPSKHLSIVAPQSGDTVSGSVKVEVDQYVGEDASNAEIGVSGDFAATRSLLPYFTVDTLGLSNGKHELGYRVTDADGKVWEDTIEVTVDNPTQRLLEARFERSTYAPGEEVVVALRYNEEGLLLSGDFSELDSRFVPGTESFEDLGDGDYVLRYQVAANSQQTDGPHYLQVAAFDAEDRSVVSNLQATQQKLPTLPIQVAGSMRAERGQPDVNLVTEAPHLMSVTGDSALLTGGSLDLKLEWDQTQTAPASRILLQVSGYDGYIVVPVEEGATEQTVQVQLPRLAAENNGAPLELLVTVVDQLGNAIEWVKKEIVALIVGGGGVQVSLTWNNLADLDLQVLDPEGQLINWASNLELPGTLDLDANSECEETAVKAENIFWPSGKEVVGDYKVLVNLYDLCTETTVDFNGTITVCGRTKTFKGTLGSADQNPVLEGLGKEFAEFSFDCRNRVNGKIQFPKLDNLPGPGRIEPFVPSVVMTGVPFASVRAVRTTDGKCLAAGSTDAEGNYDLRFINDGDPKYHLEVGAQTGDYTPGADSSTCGTFKARAEVVNPADMKVYVEKSMDIDGAMDPEKVLNFDIPGAPSTNAGAFNITYVAAQEINWLAIHWSNDLPPIQLRWADGLDTMGSFFQPPNPGVASTNANTFIVVNGAAGMPQHWSDSVIAHEFMHYVVSHFSKDDSMGGPHFIGDQSAPTLAWSEGAATGFAHIILGRPIYVDMSAVGGAVSCSICLDLDRGDMVIPAGTLPANSQTGRHAEWIDSYVLWDLMDADDPSEPGDKLSGDFNSLLTSIFKVIPSSRPNRGVTGADLVDFLDGWRCTDQSIASGTGTTGHDTELKDLLQQSIIQFPYDFAAKGGTPALVCP